MRILHVSDVYLPRLGGIEMQVHDLADQQRRRGHGVQVITRTPSGNHEDALAVRRLGALAWTRTIAGGEFDGLDVVHCHTSIFSPLAWTYARSAAAAGVPVVITMHSIVQPDRGVRTGLRPVFTGLGPVTWTAVSRVAADALQPLVRTPVQILPNGIDPTPWRRLHSEPPEVATLVSVMRLSARKRALPLVDILAGVRDRLDPSVPLRAVVIGDGPQRDIMWRAIRRRGLHDWVHLTGRLTREEIAVHLARASMFLAPARLESFGIAPLEARCAGVPVLALLGGGVEEFVRDGVEGRLVANDRAMAIAAAELIAEPERLLLMRKHNTAEVTDLDWPRVVDRTLAVYRSALAPQPLARS